MDLKVRKPEELLENSRLISEKRRISSDNDENGDGIRDYSKQSSDSVSPTAAIVRDRDKNIFQVPLLRFNHRFTSPSSVTPINSRHLLVPSSSDNDFDYLCKRCIMCYQGMLSLN